MTTNWSWKNKNNTSPGLLYESGNWGDLLKLLWVKTVIEWKSQHTPTLNYLDPFAGDVHYPLSPKTRHRLRMCRTDDFTFINDKFLSQQRWPSAAAAAALLIPGTIQVWDADNTRRSHWENIPNVTVADTDSGYALLHELAPEQNTLRLIDPYDFLAEWREHLPHIIRQSYVATTLLYLYNRSARKEEHFKNYRDFKNALEDAMGDRPKRLGRIAADAFLPRSHHEMLLLPSNHDLIQKNIGLLFTSLADQSAMLADGLRRAAACEA